MKTMKDKTVWCLNMILWASNSEPSKTFNKVEQCTRRDVKRE